MFDMGFWEIALIFILLLLVVGPDKLPGLARTIGFWVGKARSMVSSVKREVEQEMRLQDIQRSLSQHSTTNEIKRLADQVRSINSEVRSVGSDIKANIEKSATQPIPPTTIPKEAAQEKSTDEGTAADGVKNVASQVDKPAQDSAEKSPSTSSNNASTL